MLELLKSAVKARLNIVVSGGTGAGKTTLLNGLSSFISEGERIVTIEDSGRTATPAAARCPNGVSSRQRRGQGAVRQRDLVINALRMRPDRIVLGEVRGGEALDMLQAMNTGHDGSLTTIHANNPRDAIARLETMCLDGRRQSAGQGHSTPNRRGSAHRRAGRPAQRWHSQGDAYFRGDRGGGRDGDATRHLSFLIVSASARTVVCSDVFARRSAADVF
jgi:stage III sporulation protein SpoIIIAA